MPVMKKVMETVAKFVPEKETDPLAHQHEQIGRPLSRVDGPPKVKGEARFSAEFPHDNLAHAVPVFSTVAKGKIVRIDLAEASKAPGVIQILTHENAPKIKTPTLMNVNRPGEGFAGSDLPILQSAEVHHDGEPVALVIAETLEQAEHAAWLVHVEYERAPARVSFEALKGEAETPPEVMGEDPEVRIGDADKALAAAAFKVDNIYRTPGYNQNALEPHSTIAHWSDEKTLTLYDSSQFVIGFKHQMATIFGLKPDHVRVLAPFVGGAFGGKGALWPHTILCAMAAKVTRRPVKLMLSREGVFRTVGGRTVAEQRVALGADAKGNLQAIHHSGITATTDHAKYPEQLSLTPRHMYSSANLYAGQKVVSLDTVANTWMRAPGESIATFALESAIDELANAMKIDPIELRRINEPAKDPTRHTEFSLRNLLEAYRRGAQKFGWKHRAPQSQRDGKWLIGQGVATAYYPFFRWPAKVRLRISADGTALVQAAAHEMGMGTATVQIQTAAQRLGIPIDKVTFEYGDSDLPDSPILAGGSSQTVTLAAALHDAVDKAQREVKKAEGESWAEALRKAKKEQLEVEGAAGQAVEMLKFSMASYGAQFCEVRVNEETGEVRVSRWVGSFDCGRVINPKTAGSQFRGGIIMGIGMALTEQAQFDDRRGRLMNRSLAEYHVPVNLDVPNIEVIYTDIPDEHAPLGAHGVGEIGITGAAAAVANAVFNATGKRIRELPITLDKLL